MAVRLEDEALDRMLAKVPTWSLVADGKTIERDFWFADFVHAFAFMTQVAEIAEAIDHHPDWSNSYNRIRIRLTTHEADGLTERDFVLAGAIDGLI